MKIIKQTDFNEDLIFTHSFTCGCDYDDYTDDGGCGCDD